MGKCVQILGTVLLLGVIGAVWPAEVNAAGSWTSGDFTWGGTTRLATAIDEQRCFNETVTIVGVASLPENGRVCIYERPDFRYAIYHKSTPNWWGGSSIQSYFVVGLGNDRKLYVVENMSTATPLDVPGSNDIHHNSLTMGFTNNHLISYIADFPSKLTRVTEFGQTLRYQLMNDASQPFIPTLQSHPVTTGAVTVSKDGKWMVAEVMGGGLVRINTATRQLQGFSNYRHSYGYGSDAHITFRISSDGSKIAAFDFNITPTVYSLSDGCLVYADSYSDEYADRLRNTQCPTDEGRLSAALNQKLGYAGARSARAAAFNSDDDTLYFDSYEYENSDDWMTPTVYRTPLHAGNYVAEASIAYMALGDSFTSGEGDIEKKVDGSSYYLPGTEKNNECHLSSRSYPYLIRNQLNIEPHRMQSVACSGAQVLPDYIGNPESYRGQANRINNLTGYDLKTTRQLALENFSPGIVTQLEFVKKYQPKTITLMGGGNDVGFGSILEYCASPSWEGVFVDGTCGYAVEGHELQKILGRSIQTQYGYTLMLLRMIKQASPTTTVYVIGYPSFISEDPHANCLNSAVLDDDERTMIHDGVTTMNHMLEAAATSVGVKYIDIQDVLMGGRLCEGSEYVTGVTNVMMQISNRDSHEMFHPNALAHTRIANRILAEDFQIQASHSEPMLADPLKFDALTPFGVSEARTSLPLPVTDNFLKEQSSLELRVAPGALAPNSTADITMYSNSAELGQYAVSSDGGLLTSVNLPSSLKPGRHVLVLDGQSPSGEPLTYYQFVTVVSNQSNDLDSDGVSDASDPCLFITSWISETSGKNVCLTQTIDDKKGMKNEFDAPPPSVSNAESAVDTQERGVISPRVERGIPNPVSPFGTKFTNSNESTGADRVLDNESKNGNGEREGDVRGVKSTASIAQTPLGDEMWMIGVIGLSTLVGGYGILRAIRSRA